MNGVRTAKIQTKRSKQNLTSPAVPSAQLKYYAAGLISALINDAVVELKGHYSNADATLDKIRIKSRIEAEGPGFAFFTLPCLIKGLLDLKETGVASFPQFKLQRGTEHPAFLGRLFHLALFSVDHQIRVRAIDIIYTISVCFKKYKADYPKSVLVKQFTKFVEVDKELDQINWFSEPLFPILEEARRLWSNFANTIDLDCYTSQALPRPGPGATNTPTNKSDRYRPSVLYKQIDNVMSYQEWFYPTPWDACYRSAEFLALYNNAKNEPTARFKFVPKTIGKPRGICIEENEMQVMQQAVRVYLYARIQRLIGSQVHLTRQETNAELALSSSMDLTYATIDMSEASDRVARELVSWVSQDNQSFHDILMALSTRYVVPPLDVKREFPNLVRTKKYAPMGSALCFPVMSLIHLFLIQAIIRCSALPNSKSLNERVYVYGDDIILPVEAVDAVYTYLPMFGMKLNKDKSFYRSKFRESCGIHAYDGVDITPVYCKYTPYHKHDDAQASCLAVEKQLFDKRFFFASKFQRLMISKHFPRLNVEVPDGLSLAGITRDYDADSLRRFKLSQRRGRSLDYQCRMYTINKLVKRQTRCSLVKDDESYLRWLWMHTEDSRVFGDSYGSTSIIRRTVPESALGSAVVGQSIMASLKKCQTLNYMTFPQAHSAVMPSTLLGSRA